VRNLVATALRGLLQVGERLRQQNRIGVAVVREGHLPDAHREPLRAAFRTLAERDLLDVRADPLSHSQRITASGVQQDDRDGRRKLADQVRRPDKLRDLLREGSLDLLANLLPVAGDARPQNADREEVLLPRRAARLASQQMTE